MASPGTHVPSAARPSLIPVSVGSLVPVPSSPRGIPPSSPLVPSSPRGGIPPSSPRAATLLSSSPHPLSSPRAALPSPPSHASQKQSRSSASGGKKPVPGGSAEAGGQTLLSPGGRAPALPAGGAPYHSLLPQQRTGVPKKTNHLKNTASPRKLAARLNGGRGGERGERRFRQTIESIVRSFGAHEAGAHEAATWCAGLFYNSGKGATRYRVCGAFVRGNVD